MAEATTGPWLLSGPDQFGDYTIHGPKDSLAIAAVVNGLVRGICRESREQSYNARLIAAAPELLAALKLVESEYGYMGDADTCECGENSDGIVNGKPCEHRIVRAAIAKATGDRP